MKKLATALALIAMTAGSLVALEGASFAAVRHGKRPVARQTIARKKGKTHKNFDESSLFARRTTGRKKVRRHRKGAKTPKNPSISAMRPISA